VQRSEIRAAGALAADATAGIGGLVRGVHEAVAARVFGALGPAGAPARLWHDGILRGVHVAVRGGLRTLPRGGSELLALRAGLSARPLEGSGCGALALAAINGYRGDMLAEAGSPLALEMTLRRRGADVAPEPDALAAAFPDATGRLAVFVHGLAESDDSWRLAPIGRGGGARRTYGERLREELGYVPLAVRYNSGRHVSDNGAALAELLEAVVAAWPVAVDEVVLVGHSMGGLVVRSACHAGAHAGHRWSRRVRHVVTLGTPHLGADLEKAANAVGWALTRVGETRPLGRVVNQRSAGIKDMRFGSVAQADWHGHDPDELLRDRCREVPFLPDASYHFIGATLASGPLGRVLGDLIVRPPSASGTGRPGGRSIPFDVDGGARLEGLTHFDLLNHPAVYEQLRRWLARGPGPLAASGV
jgi:pimeloyl-ACP methyl ester carboxylesterase